MKPSCSLAMAALVALGITAGDTRAQEPQLFTPVNQVDQKLMTWMDNQESMVGMTGNRLVNVDYDVLQGLADGPFGGKATMDLDLFGQTKTIELTKYNKQWKYHIFRGEIEGYDKTNSIVVFAFGEGATAGFIEFDDYRFMLNYTGQGRVHGLMQFDTFDRLPNEVKSCGLDDAQMEYASQFPLGAANPVISPVALDGSGGPVVDVATFYTPLARSQSGGTSAVESAISAQIALSNTVNTNSGANFTFRSVHIALTNYSELGNSTDVNRFRNNGDGFMDEVHALRNTFGADLMHLVTGGGAGFCGIAFSIMCTESVNFRTNAFCNTLRNCFSNKTFPHEMGHIMGCAHDRANAGCGCFSYSYGDHTANNQYRSIMAYSPGTRTNYWSGPNSIAPNGQAMGNGSNQNTETHNNATDTVAAFRPTQVGANPATLTSLSQTSQLNYNLIPVQVTINGQDLDTVTQLDIGGNNVAIGSQSYSALTFILPNGFEIGTHQVVATNFAGASNTLNYTVNAISPPQMTSQVLATSGNPTDLDMWGNAGEVYTVFLSTSPAPSVLPGIASFTIGNNFTSFFYFAAVAADSGGRANINYTIPFGTLPPLTTLYFQAVYGPVVAPLSVTNSTSTTWF